MKTLLTGARGLPGTYIRKVLEGNDLTTVECNSNHLPELPRQQFDLVVHADGTSDPAHAIDLNAEGTQRLLASLEPLPAPTAFCFISSYEVYSDTSGEMVTETHPTWPSSETGRSMILAEKAVTEWCTRRNVPLTILRPATMFGRGMTGWATKMFADVASGRYIHVRGNDSHLSVVTALDVARAVKATVGLPGIFNVADDVSPRWIDLAEAMSANTGHPKRMMVLPPKWAAMARRLCDWLPAVKASLCESDTVCARRFRSLTLDCTRLHNAVPDWKPYDTLAVLARTEPDYPYEDE